MLTVLAVFMSFLSKLPRYSSWTGLLKGLVWLARFEGQLMLNCVQPFDSVRVGTMASDLQ